MADFKAEPYNLAFDQLIEVRATATNAYGPALLPSESNEDGAKIR
jgi:hypothetical protein